MRKYPSYRSLLFAVCVPMLLLAASDPARADFITSSDQLNVDSTVTWGVIGNSIGISYSSDPNTLSGLPETYIPAHGIPPTYVYVIGPYGYVTRLNQGLGWNGSFMPGEELIWSSADGSIRIEFVNNNATLPSDSYYAPVAGFGARYEDAVVGPYTGRLRGFDEFDNLLFAYDLSGVAQRDGVPGSASFFGAVSTKRNIAYIYYDRLDVIGPGELGGFALGTLYIQADPVPVNTVPAPPAAILLLTGLFPLAFVLRLHYS